MIQNKKRIISLILMLTLLVSSLVVGAITASAAEEKTYTFSSYTAGVQYANGEEHQLDSDVKLTINGAHLNTQVRLYAGSNAVLSSTKKITKVVLNAGNKAGTLTVYASNNGSDWDEISAQSTTTSYKDYIFDLGGEYSYVKMESAGAQIRVAKATLTLVGGCAHANTTENNTATCTEAGVKTVHCSDCDTDINVTNVPALGHNYVDGVCDREGCGAEKPNTSSIDMDIFASTGKLSSDSSSISWTKGGFTVTNRKGSTAIRTIDSDHFRAYANSSLEIDGGSNVITEIKITANGTSFVAVLSTSLGNSNYAVTSDGTVVTVSVPDASKISFTLSAQAQITKIAITYIVNDSGEPTCEHTNTTTNTVDATCNAEGSTTVTCDDCDETLSTETIPATGEHTGGEATCTAKATCTVCGEEYGNMKPHNYVEGECSVCKGKISFESTITFDDYSKCKDNVWQENGISVIYDGTANTYDNPARFYKNSKITISFPKMIKLVINANGIDSDYKWNDTLAGYNFTVEDGVYTITFAEPTDSITLTAANQVRAYSITATTTCEHVDENTNHKCDVCGVAHHTFATTWTIDNGQHYKACIVDGCNEKLDLADCADTDSNHYCDGCNTKLSEHNYATETSRTPATCTSEGSVTKQCVCGATTTETLGIDADAHNYTSAYTAPTCTADGFTTYTCQYNSEHTYTVTNEGSATNHAWDNDCDTTCNNNCGLTRDPSHTGGTAATCTTAQTCTVCGAELAPALGHTPGSAADCENDQTCTVCGDVLVEALGHNHNACPHKAAVDGEYFKSFEAALEAVKTSEDKTLVLNGDVEDTNAAGIDLTGITIDLNGHKLTAAGVIDFSGTGAIKDSSAGKAGRVVVKKGGFIGVSNKTLPVCVAEDTENGTGTYVIADVKDQYMCTPDATNSKYVLEFRPSFVGIAHFDIFANGTTEEDITFWIRITRDSDDSVVYGADIWVDAKYVKVAYSERRTIRLTLTNATKGEVYTIQLVMKSGNQYQYVGNLGTIKADGSYEYN